MIRNRPLTAILCWLALSASAVLFAQDSTAPNGAAPNNAAQWTPPPFFAFQNGVRLGTPDDEARVLKELGYDGISQVFLTGDPLAKKVAAFDKAGLKVLSVYLNVDDKPIAEDAIRPLANRNAIVELTVRKMTPQTVDAVRETAATAEKLNVGVAIYPHHGFAVATMPQAMELITTVDHPNLGVMFNLCHFLKNESADDLEKVLKQAGDKLFAVSTSGANVDGDNWGELIQTLDQGDFPQRRLLRALKEMQFAGPVGLQCYGIRGDSRGNLQRSMSAWKEIVAER